MENDLNNENSLINVEICFEDLVKDKFDLAQHDPHSSKLLYKAKSEYKVKDSDHSVKYKYNNEFFRSDDFLINKPIGLHVLFSGCSESEGVGDNIENTWTHMLYKKLSEEIKCSGFFNLSRSGWGWSKVVINALIYFEKYGYPDVYFILLPNHQRSHKFLKDGAMSDDGKVYGYWQYKQSYPSSFYLNSKSKKIHAENMTLETEYKEDFIKFLTGWKLFNKICIDNNIKLIFSTWDEYDSAQLKHIKMFDNFFNLDQDNKLPSYMEEYYKTNDVTPYDLKKRDGHSGKVIHNFWADSFYDFYKKETSNV